MIDLENELSTIIQNIQSPKGSYNYQHNILEQRGSATYFKSDTRGFVGT